ncbi:YphA family membrane protein [Cytobacillus gottheilii]|uniref:YphA family membrane protein n=1 Tax=Cytobacillus gottheilii TaxID=859144 RepID=UPI0009BB7AA4|nr:hypothetical protein [Cytobacillus gottheilii]
MDGILFYFTAWGIWILTTFFIDKKQPYRLGLSVWILLLIIFSARELTLGTISVSFSAIFIVLTIYVLLAKYKFKKLCYFLVCQLIGISAYASFHLFEMFDPVWVIIGREWMLSAILVILSSILMKAKFERFILLASAAIHGEVVNGIIFHSFSFPYHIGSFVYLDILSISTLVLLIWNGVEYMTAYLGTYFNQLEKERGRTS